MAQFNYEVSYPHVVGGYLKRKLKNNGITQEEFSDKFCVDVRTVRRWLRDGVHSLDTVVEIACYFEVSVGDVLSDEDSVPFQFNIICRGFDRTLCVLSESFFLC